MKLRFDERNHGYWLDGKRCKSVTTVAKIPDDLYRLQQWEKRQVAIGLASSKDLLQAVAAHSNDADVLNGLCDKAKEVAGANRGATRGTAAHRITELSDQGHHIIPSDLATSILGSWKDVLLTAGLEVIPELMERVVVFPEQRLCGKFDRICRMRVVGIGSICSAHQVPMVTCPRCNPSTLVMVDLKSGDRAIQYPHAIAVQLALYANAPFMAGPLDAKGQTEVFEPLPALRKDYAIVIHIPEVGKAQAVKIDIAQGWATAQEICFPTIRWRALRAEDLVQAL